MTRCIIAIVSLAAVSCASVTGKQELIDAERRVQTLAGQCAAAGHQGPACVALEHARWEHAQLQRRQDQRAAEWSRAFEALKPPVRCTTTMIGSVASTQCR